MADKHGKYFAGAGIIVREPDDTRRTGSAIVVETAHAVELSNLIFDLKAIFANSIDYFSKFEFYGRLAEAANEQLRQGDDATAIKNAVLEEACIMADEMGAHLYFAYGSNMDENQMAWRCPESLFVGVATLQNYKFELDSAGVATVIEENGSQVPGALWLISESDEYSLDGYEGVAGNYYRKAQCAVNVDSDKELCALVYISNRKTHDGETYRSGYMDNIIKNAKRLGFDADYVNYLETK